MSTENTQQERVKVWPEMVLRETLAAMVAMIFLVLASMMIQAPLESLANPSFSMNPSKAPWYFLGLQEMLVYFSPWVAGVAVPILVVIGLMAVPYLDVAGDVEGERSFPFERPIKIIFSVGLGLWLALTLVGLFFRGKNWLLQWPDGTQLGSGSHIVLDWVMPAAIIGYLLVTVAFSFRRFRPKIIKMGLWRRALTHAMGMSVLAIFAKIVLYTILDLTLNS